MVSRRRLRALLAVALAAGGLAAGPPPAAPPPAAAPSPAPAAPADPGLIEKTGVALFLLDIEVRDRSGNPMRGLTAADFVVRRNGRLWPVVTADDFCTCVPESSPATVAATAGATEATPTPARAANEPGPPPLADDDSAPPAPERPLVVIYFDFGQMRSDGRHLAVEAARRWVRSVRAPGDRVMIAGYVTSRGLLTLAEPTTDEARLLRALDDAADNVLYSDNFAQHFPDRVEECLRRDPTTCPWHAITEYDHGRRSVSALQLFMTQLGARPGPKTVLFFHENEMMQTGAIYLQRDRRTHYERVEQVGAEATAAHVTLHPLVVAMDTAEGTQLAQATGFAATLAESTGGSYNRGPLDLDRVVQAATTGCRCRYVLGLKPLEDETRSIASVSVRARGVLQRALYRVRPMSVEDRFLRQASAVLENPAAASDLGVGVAIRPARAGSSRWDLTATVAVDARVMALLPQGASRRAGGWEVGARLQRLGTSSAWEMLATSVATTGAGGAPDTMVVYEHPFTGLAPGRYRLSAFMRDRVANLFGGGEAFLELPDPAKGGIAGPVMLLAHTPRLVSPLPLLDRRSEMRDLAATTDAGPAPAASIALPRGTLLRFESWICGAPGGAPAEATARLLRDDTPVLRFDDAVVAPAAGGCVPRADEVATGGLEPGRYLYEILVRRGPERATSSTTPFVIAGGVPPGGAEPGGADRGGAEPGSAP